MVLRFAEEEAAVDELDKRHLRCHALHRSPAYFMILKPFLLDQVKQIVDFTLPSL
jgi:hypothetical protein